MWYLDVPENGRMNLKQAPWIKRCVSNPSKQLFTRIGRYKKPDFAFHVVDVGICRWRKLKCYIFTSTMIQQIVPSNLRPATWRPGAAKPASATGDKSQRCKNNDFFHKNPTIELFGDTSHINSHTKPLGKHLGSLDPQSLTLPLRGYVNPTPTAFGCIGHSWLCTQNLGKVRYCHWTTSRSRPDACWSTISAFWVPFVAPVTAVITTSLSFRANRNRCLMLNGLSKSCIKGKRLASPASHIWIMWWLAKASQTSKICDTELEKVSTYTCS